MTETGAVKTYTFKMYLVRTRKQYVLHDSAEVMPVHYTTKSALNTEIKRLKAAGYIADENTVTLIERQNVK